jgi:hypothetical protein
MSCFPILETRWLNGTDAKVAANGDAYAGHQRAPLHHCGRSLKARLSARCMTMSSKWLFVGKQPESLAGSGILAHQTHTRSTAVARCVRSLFLSPKILSLSQPGRMPLAALQIAFRILFHLVLHPMHFDSCRPSMSPFSMPVDAYYRAAACVSYLRIVAAERSCSRTSVE